MRQGGRGLVFSVALHNVFCHEFENLRNILLNTNYHELTTNYHELNAG